MADLEHYEIEIIVRDAKSEKAVTAHAEYRSYGPIAKVPHELLQHVIAHAGASRLREIDESR